MRLKSWCYGGIPSTRIAIWAVAITQWRLVTALDRGRQCIVLFGENHLHEPLLRLPLRFDPRLRTARAHNGYRVSTKRTNATVGGHSNAAEITYSPDSVSHSILRTFGLQQTWQSST